MSLVHLLLFLDDADAPACWLRTRDGEIVARGQGDDAPDGPWDKIVLVVPAADVRICWLDLPESLTVPQAAAAARLEAGGASLDPAEMLHVAAGLHDTRAGARPVAYVTASRMAAWLAAAGRLGLDPDHVVPASLLMPAPNTGLVCFAGAAPPLYRGPRAAFAAEPDIASAALPAERVAEVDGEAFLAAAARQAASPLLDLRQGAFARRRRIRIDGKAARRIAVPALLLLLATFAVELSALLRYTFAADRLETAHAALLASGDPRQRLAAQGGGAGGYGAMAGVLIQAVRETPHVALASLRYDRAGASLQALLHADDAAAVAALQGRLEAKAVRVAAGPLISRDGRQQAELRIEAR